MENNIEWVTWPDTWVELTDPVTGEKLDYNSTYWEIEYWETEVNFQYTYLYAFIIIFIVCACMWIIYMKKFRKKK